MTARGSVRERPVDGGTCDDCPEGPACIPYSSRRAAKAGGNNVGTLGRLNDLIMSRNTLAVCGQKIRRKNSGKQRDGKHHVYEQRGIRRRVYDKANAWCFLHRLLVKVTDVKALVRRQAHQEPSAGGDGARAHSH
ncbi:hypothetical protein MTO96_002747 [Rhipicephalus appendiculatus]